MAAVPILQGIVSGGHKKGFFVSRVEMDNGWIKLHRKLHDSDFWLQEKFTKAQAWVDLLMLANYRPGFIRKRGIRINLVRGDIGRSELELAKRWKWSRGKVRRFLSELCSENEKKLVQKTVQQNKNVTSCYHILNYDLYQTGDTTDGTTNGHQTVQQTDTKRYRNKKNKKEKKEKNNNIYSRVCDYLNLKTGKNFRSTTKKTQTLIQARQNEGFEFEDFKSVIDNQTAKWLTDSKMMEYLRPETLFGTKFESYLNNHAHPLQGKVSETTMKNIETFKKWGENAR